MTLRIKDQILVTNPKAIKILKKDITKRILKCFNEEPKTASQIANSISFPKDKIYYHIKNLISLDILFIAEKTMVKGIKIIDDTETNPLKKQLRLIRLGKSSPLKGV